MSSRATVLYDAPGPRARVRNNVLSVLVAAALLALGWLVFHGFEAKGQFTSAKWRPFLEASTWTTYLLPGLEGTVLAAVISIAAALTLGMVFGILRLSEHRIISWVAGAVVEVFRSLPVLILMIFTFGLYSRYQVFQSDHLALAAVVTALTAYNGAVIAEIVRAGIRALPQGQTEAAQALGMRRGAIMRLILLPQAVTAMLPALISQMVVVLKDSALGYQITYIEVVRSAQQLGAAQQNTVPALIVVAVVIIALNVALSTTATRVERRLRRRGRSVI